MKPIFLKIKFVILLPLLVVSAYAQDPVSTAGTASNLLLRFDLSPRVSALSGSFTAVADDESAILYNPGGLPTLNQGMVSLNHTEWFEDIRIDNLSAAFPITRSLTAAAAFTHMWMPGIAGKDNLGRDTGILNVSSSVAHLGLGYKWFSGFQTGFGARYFFDDLAGYRASGFAFDFGIHAQTFLQGLTFGMAITNFGNKIHYDDQAQEIPRTYRAGLAYRFFNPGILLSADVVKSTDTDYTVLFGGEYQMNGQFVFRMGNSFTNNEMLKPSFGLGFNLNNDYFVDYTFSSFSDLGFAHRLGFSFHFNTPATKKRFSSLYREGAPTIAIAPKNVRVILFDGVLEITWNTIPGAKYNVYARHSSKYVWEKLNQDPLYLAKKDFKKPTAKGTYFFKVTSIVNGKESPYSEEVTFEVK